MPNNLANILGMSVLSCKPVNCSAFGPKAYIDTTTAVCPPGGLYSVTSHGA